MATVCVPSIEHEEHDVCPAQHARGEGGCAVLDAAAGGKGLQAAGVDDGKGQVAQGRDALLVVAGDVAVWGVPHLGATRGTVVGTPCSMAHQCVTATYEPVVQGRLADVGASDQCHLGVGARLPAIRVCAPWAGVMGQGGGVVPGGCSARREPSGHTHCCAAATMGRRDVGLPPMRGPKTAACRNAFFLSTVSQSLIHVYYEAINNAITKCWSMC